MCVCDARIQPTLLARRRKKPINKTSKQTNIVYFIFFLPISPDLRRLFFFPLFFLSSIYVYDLFMYN